MSPRKVRAYALLFIATFIWAIAGLVIKFTLNGFSPFDFLFYRLLISSVISIIIIKLSHVKTPARKHWPLIVLFSLFQVTFGLGFLFLGMTQATVLSLSLVTLAFPLLTSIAGVVFLKDKITLREKKGTVIALLGTALTLAEPIIQNRPGTGSITGNLLLCLHILFDIGSVVALKMLLKKGVDVIFVSNTAFVIGAVSLIPYALVQGNSLLEAITTAPFIFHLGVIYMAVFSGNLAYILRARAQKTLEVSEASLFGYLVPIFTVPLAVLLLGETITTMFVVGSIIVILGVIIAETKNR